REQGARRRDAPDTATGLDLAWHRRGDRLDLRQVRRLTGAGGVEIDDVEPLGTGRRERARHCHGVVVVDRLRGEVSLPEANGAPGTQVDRGVEREAHAPLSIR